MNDFNVRHQPRNNNNDNIAPNAKCQRVLVLALRLVPIALSLLSTRQAGALACASDGSQISSARRADSLAISQVPGENE